MASADGSVGVFSREIEAVMTKKSQQKPPWKKPNPRKTSKPLSPQAKAAAKQRAKRAGREYPNLIDNMVAASKDPGKSGKK